MPEQALGCFPLGLGLAVKDEPFELHMYVNVHTCSNSTVTCIQHKMYAGERDVQKVLYAAQNVRWGASCAKSALYSTKCTLGSELCKKCSIQHKMYAGERDV